MSIFSCAGQKVPLKTPFNDLPNAPLPPVIKSFMLDSGLCIDFINICLKINLSHKSKVLNKQILGIALGLVSIKNEVFSMRKINIIASAIVMAVLLSIAVFSQLAPITNVVSKTNQVTPAISLEEKDTCTTSFYDESQDVFGNYNYYSNYTHCLNTSGPNTACSIQQSILVLSQKVGQVTVTKNKTECKPNDKFVISIDQGTATLKKQIDYSEWGHCIYNEEKSCLIVTCVSRYDGAHKGQFTDCKGGKSCQRFEICDNNIKTLYKNSREGFAEDDPSFYLNKLPLAEAAK